MVSEESTAGAEKPNLFGLDRQQLAELLQARYGVPAFHGAQVYRWLYARQVLDPSGWTDLSKELRRLLTDETRVDPGRFAARATAGDGTVKYRTVLPGGDTVECVSMEQAGRATLCISSQVGCALDCDFCLTGKMGMKRHLSTGEIVGQVTLMRQEHESDGRPFNVVFMGMGEPLHNYDAVLATVRILNDPDGFALSRRRITVSTSGLAPASERLAGEPVLPRLAVSLNATTDAIRDRIMPVNRKYPLDQLLEACASFARSTGERFSFEYVLLRGINDSDADIARLAKIVRRVPAKVNLIPFNPVPGWLEYRPPTEPRIEEFRERLTALGVRATIRWSRGAEARAACGQLALLPESPETPSRPVGERPLS
jgi:23S rRNA (adenine2503-C2)-methyltransferase